MNWNIKPENKEGIIGFGLAALVFWLLTKTLLKKEPDIVQPVITEENINTAIDAYKIALNNNAPQSELNDLNTELVKDYGLRVFQRNSDGRLVVTDLSGKEVRVV